MKIKIIIFLMLFVLFHPELYSGPRKDLMQSPSMSSFVTAQTPLQGNNIQSFVWNTGVFNQDLRTTDTPGFYWPKGQTHAAIFTTGLSICANYNGNLRAAMGSYKGEYRPGYVDNSGAYATDSRFKLYNVNPSFPDGGLDPITLITYDSWSDYAQMIPFGAPYVDIDSNGVYSPGIDKAGIKDAAQTVFVCVTDADQSSHSSSEGFGGGSQPLFVQVGLTAWCYDGPGLEDLQFIKWVVVNRSPVTWTDTYLSVVVDPDLGDANDDYIGCDTTTETSNGHQKPKNMGYCYNSDDQDGNGTARTYGLHPPASGMDYFLSPIIPTGNNNDTVFIYNPPGSKNLITKVGYKEIGASSFDFFTNTGSGGPVCQQDPGTVIEAYNYMKGLKKDGSPWINPYTQTQTLFCYPGDPSGGTGSNNWTEFNGSVPNCGGPTGTPNTGPNAPGDRRFIFNSGSFNMAPNDTQFVVLAQFVARGSDNKNSVTKLKNVDVTAQRIFDHNFAVIPPPPPPVVSASYSPSTAALGTANITLSWGDISENFSFRDEIFGGTFNFEGYEIYEVRKDLTSFPNFNSLTDSRDGLTLVAIYDKENLNGVIIDSLPNGQGGFATVQVLPAFGFNNPSNFPDYGIQRHITLTQTNYASVNNGNDKFVYGNTYKFVVVAYAYNPNGLPGGKILRNSLASQVLTVTPEAPLLGTQFFFKNGDTLNTSKRDLGLMPIVVNQEKVIDAKYRIVYNNPDTTYNIYKSIDNGANFSLAKSNLKFTNYGLSNSTLPDDSSRIVDGILLKAQKIRYQVSAPPGTYAGNVGVVQDPVFPRDSVQTRLYGWDYNPPQNQYLEGSKYFSSTLRLYQSKSMSLSYPTRNTYVGFKSALNPEDLRKVKIVFTGYGNGQQSYRYLVTTATNYAYQDMREVPFKVYEIDETDGSPIRQLNCAFLEFPDGAQDNKWEPTADSTGGKDILYIFNSNYDANPNVIYTSKNLLIQQPTIDVMYIWSAKLRTAGATFHVNDEFIIYPYTVTRPEISVGHPLYYEFDTRKAVVTTEEASQTGGLSNIKVVPNPYYGFNNLETSTSGRFVTFRNLPINCSVKIYTLNGDLIKTLNKNDNNSTLQWPLNNQSSTPVASGIYLALVDAPGIGTTVIKIAIFTPEERIDF